MRINSNSSLGTLNQISLTSKKVSQVFEQLSSGKKINRAGDNPAASALVNSLKSNTSGLNVANQNIGNARGALNVASGAIGSSIEQLQGLRDLAVQSANGTLNASDRAALNEQFQQGVANLNDISQNTSFGGTKLLDGSFNQSIQTGAEAGQTNDVEIGDVSANALGVSTQNVNSQSSAEDAIGAIDSAISRALSEQSKIGAAESALEYRENANAVAAENLEAARSQVEDTDIAEATSELSRQQVLQEAQISVLKAQMRQKTEISKQLFGNVTQK